MTSLFRAGTSVISIAALVVAVGCGGATDPHSLPGDPTLAIPTGPYVPGQSYFGRNNYIEYVAGNAPVIYSAPHGGA